jgi:hypothetical protein
MPCGPYFRSWHTADALRRCSKTVCYRRSNRQGATVFLTRQAAVRLAFAAVNRAGAMPVSLPVLANTDTLGELVALVK